MNNKKIIFIVSFILNLNPIQIIEKCVRAESSEIRVKFINKITHLYKFEIFKDIFDLVSTLCLADRLKFNIYEKRFFELDEGNCRSVDTTNMNNFLNKFKATKNYLITIKKVDAEVIIHEIAHMLEQEMYLLNNENFIAAINQDLSQHATNNPSLKAAIKQIIIEELKHYPTNQHNSELFARFFQIIATAQEVKTYSNKYGYNLQNIYQFFSNTIKILSLDYYQIVKTKINSKIASSSKDYIKTESNFIPKWTSNKVTSLHPIIDKPINNGHRSQWMKVVKSIKKDPFS